MMSVNVPTFLKWAGGKQQLLERYETFFPEQIDHYVEPFLGGGAVLFFVLTYRNPKIIRAFDRNPELIGTYNAVKINVNETISILLSLQEGHASSENAQHYYYERRTEFNHLKLAQRLPKKKMLRKAALFIYLNKACFNGLYRENLLGEFNVPFNGEKEANLFNEDVLRTASRLLQKVELKCSDFRKVDYHKGEVTYFDPPYWTERTTGFTRYTAVDFLKEDQIDLAKLFYRLHLRGNRSLMLSNTDTPLIHHLYGKPQFTLSKIAARRAINSEGTGRGKIYEVLITNFRSAKNEVGGTICPTK